MKLEEQSMDRENNTLRFDVVAIGELLIDFTDHGRSENGMRLFEQNAGGAPANVLAALARLGHRTAFIGKIGMDGPGDFLRESLDGNGINTEGLVSDPNAFTTLAFVALGPGGERQFSFARKPGADTLLTKDELRLDIAVAGRILHFGSLSLTSEPMRSTTFAAIAAAKAHGRVISYDPNYRPLLWSSPEAAAEQMIAGARTADLIKVSDEEIKLLTGTSDLSEASKRLLELGPTVAVITLGKAGAMVVTREGHVTVPVFPGDVVDTTGAGDSFWGGFLSAMLERGLTPETIDQSVSYDLARVGNAVATCCVGRRGGIPAMPSRDEVKHLLEMTSERYLMA